MTHAEVQKIAKDAMEYLTGVIRPGMALAEVRAVCERRMLEMGADSFWYWDVGAFVFSGDETAVSVSGREYVTADRMIGGNDIVTVDLSPQAGDVWGDYARTIILEDGRAVQDAGSVRCRLWREGMQTGERLHDEMSRFVTENTTFEELYEEMNQRINRMGWVNLDFAGNLGHTIERRKEHRRYIEKGCGLRLSEAGYFTFEPHIGKAGSKFGFKREDIYFFEGGRLMRL